MCTRIPNDAIHATLSEPHITLADVNAPAAPMIDSRYELIRHLGGGAYGEVYEVRDHNQNQIVALKILDPSKCGPWPWAEATTLTRLRSQYILPIWNASVAQGAPYVVTEIATGGTAEDLMGTGSRPTPRDAMRVIRHASRGAARAHDDGIVHRDIKLENIFLKQDQGGALLGDFGLAHPLNNGLAPRAGTPLTMAPDPSSSAQSDVYSLGCSLYRLLTGVYPYEDKSPSDEVELFKLAAAGKPTPLRDLAPHVSTGLATVVHTAMHVDPAKRYQTATEFDSALGQLRPPKRDWVSQVPHSGYSLCWLSECPKPIAVCVQPNTPSSTNRIRVERVHSGNRIVKHCTDSVRASQTSAALKRVFRELGC